MKLIIVYLIMVLKRFIYYQIRLILLRKMGEFYTALVARLKKVIRLDPIMKTLTFNALLVCRASSIGRAVDS